MGRNWQPVHNIRAPNSSPWLTPLQLPMVEPVMHNPSLMHTRIRLLFSEICMTIAAAKPPGLIITFLISPHFILTAIAFWYLIIMIGYPQCSLYTTALMLLHVTKSLWSHQTVPIMGKSQEHSTVLNTFLRNHTTFMTKWLMHPPVLV
jgi:hypothetical protein